MDLERAKNLIIRHIDKEARRLWTLSKELHSHPELSFGEKRASAILSEFLEKRGFEVERGVAGLPTAFHARRPAGRRSSPRVAFLAEYDALPVLGHACGHNVIALASVGAALSLAEIVSPQEGGVSVFGTPGEEEGGGKVIMARKGLFRGLDAAMMIHPAGETRAEVNFLALAELRFHFTGKAAHASASPEEGINALDGVLQLFHAVSALRQHLPAGDRVHGIITEGGKAPNIVPDEASAWFYVRSPSIEGLSRLVGRVETCARGAARATGARLRIHRHPIGYAPMRVNRSLASIFRKNLMRLGMHEADPLPPLAMGSSDVANVSHEVPTIHPHVQMVPPHVSAHTPAFARAAGGPPGRRSLLLGAKALAMTGAEVLLDARSRASVRADFRAGAPRGESSR